MRKMKMGMFVGEVPLKWFLLLHLSLVINSLAGTASKLAGRQKFLSFRFMFWYGVMLFITMAFALAWQQILKNMSLTFAFTNKPITIVWGLVWGVLIFHEILTWKMLLGSVIILAGIIIGVSDKGAHAGKRERASTGRKEEDGGGTDRRREKSIGKAAEDRTASGSALCALPGAIVLAGLPGRGLFRAGEVLLAPASQPGALFAGLEKYIVIWILSVFISSVAQIMLKVEANRAHESRLKEYLNPMVVGSYAIFFLSTFLTMYALKYVPLTYSPVIEPLSYIFVPVIGVLVLKEKISRRRILGIAVMFAGIAVFSM